MIVEKKRKKVYRYKAVFDLFRKEIIGFFPDLIKTLAHIFCIVFACSLCTSLSWEFFL